MKYVLVQVMFVSLILTFYSANNQSMGQTGVKMELISTKLVNKVNAPFHGDWYSTDTTQMKGLVIKVKMSKTPEMEEFNTGRLFFEFENNGEKTRVSCLGMTLVSKENEDGIWMLNSEDKGYYTITPPEEEKTEYQDFLFPIPPTINSGVLKYEILIDMVKIQIK